MKMLIKMLNQSVLLIYRLQRFYSSFLNSLMIKMLGELLLVVKICPLEFARKGFNIIFDRFPFSGSFVKMYCEMEEAAKNYDVVIEV